MEILHNYLYVFLKSYLDMLAKCFWSLSVQNKNSFDLLGYCFEFSYHSEL